MGFVVESISPPNYVYVKGEVILSRYQAMKYKLKGILDIYDDDMTETGNMMNNGF